LNAFDQAIGLDQNFPGAYAQKANQLVFLGEPQYAPPLVTKAIRLSPRDQSIGVFYWILGRAYFFMPNYEDATIWLQKSVELRPNLWFNRAYLASAYALAGNAEKAKETWNEFRSRPEFAKYTVERIRSIYADEVRHNTAQVQEKFRNGLDKLFDGLDKAEKL
jgi:tetratricopeptide (TPR) repeat protein